MRLRPMERFTRILPALEQVDPVLETVEPRMRSGNIDAKAADLGLHATDAHFQVRHIVDQPVELLVQPAQVDQQNVVGLLAHAEVLAWLRQNVC
jgi:hypothetical protein